MPLRPEHLCCIAFNYTLAEFAPRCAQHDVVPGLSELAIDMNKRPVSGIVAKAANGA